METQRAKYANTLKMQMDVFVGRAVYLCGFRVHYLCLLSIGLVCLEKKKHKGSISQHLKAVKHGVQKNISKLRSLPKDSDTT